MDLNACLISIYGTNSNAFSTATGFPTSTVYSTINSAMIANVFLTEIASSI